MPQPRAHRRPNAGHGPKTPPTPPDKAAGGGWGGLLLGLGLCAAIARGLTHLAQGGQPMAALLVVYPPLWWLGLGVLGQLFFRRHRGLVLGVWLGVFFCGLGLNVPWRLLRPPTPKAALTVATWNVHMGAMGPNGLIQTIRQTRADVWALQEVTPWRKNPGLNRPAAQKAVGGAQALVAGGETILLSRLPVLAQKVHQPGQRRTAVAAKVKTPLGPLWVVACHFETPRRSSATVLGRALRDYRKHQANVRVSLIQARRLMDWIHHLDAPAIFMGDFNTTPLMPAARVFRREHEDAFLAAGWGLGYTFHRRLPVIRIDHIYAPRPLRVAEVKVLRTPFSDHFAVVARVGK